MLVKGKHLVGVYGTLKTGRTNHHVISSRDGVFKGYGHIYGTLIEMYGGSFPGFVRSGTDDILIEIWEVSDDCLIALDRLEGNGTFYTRHIETTVVRQDKQEPTTEDYMGEWLEVWVYALPSSYLEKDHVRYLDGIWNGRDTPNRLVVRFKSRPNTDTPALPAPPAPVIDKKKVEEDGNWLYPDVVRFEVWEKRNAEAS